VRIVGYPGSGSGKFARLANSAKLANRTRAKTAKKRTGFHWKHRFFRWKDSPECLASEGIARGGMPAQIANRGRAGALAGAGARGGGNRRRHCRGCLTMQALPQALRFFRPVAKL